MTLQATAPSEDAGLMAVENIRLTVRALLAVREMTALELGEILGLNRTPMYDRIQGRKPFTTEEVARLASVFGLSVQAFFDGPSVLLGPVPGVGVIKPNKSPSQALTWPFALSEKSVLDFMIDIAA